ncbi:hypothetical protein [Lonepinella sp. BR2271]|uniref:hypothetical protein n=1 Tax=Lonepinella sp. BR2271 TaxID=3434550 RepID=UPI003F6E358C
MSKFGFGYAQVASMCHAELGAWVDSGLSALGISPQDRRSAQENHTQYVFQRRKNTVEKTSNVGQ